MCESTGACLQFFVSCGVVLLSPGKHLDANGSCGRNCGLSVSWWRTFVNFGYRGSTGAIAGALSATFVGLFLESTISYFLVFLLHLLYF